MLSRLFIAALWSPEGKWLASWLLFVIFMVILLLSHLVSWDRCGNLSYFNEIDMRKSEIHRGREANGNATFNGRHILMSTQIEVNDHCRKQEAR